MTNTNGNNSVCEASRRHRLDRIEALVESNSRAIADTRASIEQLANAAQAALSQKRSFRASLTRLGCLAACAQSNREGLQQTEQLTRRNANAIARLDEKMEQYIAEGREHREFIATQVDGIRVETRRLVEHL